MALTGVQKTKWAKLREEIINRPFLAFVLNISEAELRTYYNNQFPSPSRLAEIDAATLADREAKAERLRNSLAKLVGYREAEQFSQKVGISSTTLRNIVEKKYKVPPSYDIICQIELFLYYATDFEPSIENLPRANTFFEDKLTTMQKRVLEMSDTMKSMTLSLAELRRFDKKAKNQYTDRDFWPVNRVKYSVEKAMEDLKQIQIDLNTMIENMLK